MVFFYLIGIQFTLAQNGTELVTVTDMLKIKTVGNITLTKDGSRAAFTVTSIEPDENSSLDYKYRTQIYSISTSNNSLPVQLTTAKEGGAQPAWSPDGKQLAFTRTVGEKAQIFILSMDGGEAIQLTKHKYGASNPKWSPDGKQILFSSSISLQDLLKDSVLNGSDDIPLWPSEKPGIKNNEQWRPLKTKPNPDGSISEIRSFLDTNIVDKKAIVLNKLDFQNESNISADLTFNHFYLINIFKASEPFSLTKGFYSFSNAAFTPDGKQIILTGDIDSLEHPDRSLETEIFLADIDGKKIKMIFGDAGINYGSASLSPSGKWLAFLSNKTSFLTLPVLTIMPFNGAENEIITVPLDRNTGDHKWSKDEKYLYFTAPSNGGVLLYRFNIDTKKVETLSSFNCGITNFDIANNTIVYSKTEVSNPSELFIADVNLNNERQASHFNDWVLTKKFSFPEKKTFTNDKGMTIEYWVMKPTFYQQGKKYPLLLEIHGGPAAMWGPGERSMWHEFQFFCSKGYGVVYSNPRGSGGYGLDFLMANFKDWGNGPSRDVLTALDKTAAEGWADTSKLLITGGSYGGYLTAWIICHDKRFKAACTQRGVYDLLTFFGEGNAWRLLSEYFGGYPWEPKVKEILVRESPITYVENITTPCIILHGSNDRRTGFVQGEMMYRSLKALKRPVEYVIHPGATHEITRSGDNRQRVDQMLRTFEFFERWIHQQ